MCFAPSLSPWHLDPGTITDMELMPGEAGGSKQRASRLVALSGNLGLGCRV